jgi:hypothetical protein
MQSRIHTIKNVARLGIFTLLLATLLVSVPAAAVYAQSGGGSNTAGGGSGGGSNTPAAKTFTLQNPLKVDSLGGLIEAFVEVFSYVVILFAVLAIIYVGLQYILARGNSEEITKRTDQLKWIVIGVAVVIGARIIVSVVINTLGASGVVDQNVIRSANNAIDGK